MTEKMKHTKEPWEVSDTWIFESRRSGHVAVTVFKEQAKRIVACVNACKGISNEALDNCVILEMLHALKKARKYIYAQEVKNDCFDIDLLTDIDNAIGNAERDN